MTAPATERLLNLVIALLGSKRGRSREFIRTRVAGYDSSATEETFGRMFERDKVTLKQLGIPIQSVEDANTGEKYSWTYRIDPAEYRLPDIELDADRATVLGLAAKVWEHASLSTAAASALRKVESATGAMKAHEVGPAQSIIRTMEPAFDALWEALLNHREVTFQYRNAATDVLVSRTVQPWGLGNKYGQWYLEALDTTKEAARLFRLSRIVGSVAGGSQVFSPPEDYNIGQALDRLGSGEEYEAVVRVPAGKAQLLRAQSNHQQASPVAAGWTQLRVPYREPEQFASALAGLGALVVVEAPATLVASVRQRLTNALHAAQAPVPQVLFGLAAPPKPVKETAVDRLRRLLDLVPYLVRNSGIAFDDVAQEFAVSHQQLSRDLSLLSVCGLPGYLHGDLIDVQWEDGPVWIRDAEVLQAPLRLTQSEAAALLVGLESLQVLPGAAPAGTVECLIAELTTVAGTEAWVADVVEARISDNASFERLRLLQDAAERQLLVELDYLVTSRDELSTRVVEPQRLFSIDSSWYLQAWCYKAQSQRNFRLDNIRVVRSVPGHASAPIPEPDEAGIFMVSRNDVEVTLVLRPEAAWVADAYAAHERSVQTDGALAVKINFAHEETVPKLMAQLGGTAVVCEPAALRPTTAAWMTAALAPYAKQPSEST